MQRNAFKLIEFVYTDVFFFSRFHYTNSDDNRRIKFAKSDTIRATIIDKTAERRTDAIFAQSRKFPHSDYDKGIFRPNLERFAWFSFHEMLFDYTCSVSIMGINGNCCECGSMWQVVCFYCPTSTSGDYAIYKLRSESGPAVLCSRLMRLMGHNWAGLYAIDIEK